MLRFSFCHGLWIPASCDFIHSLSCLTKTEQEASLRYAYKRDVLSSISGKLLMRKAAVCALNIPSSNLYIERTQYGRPFYRDYSEQLDFNISHGGDYTVIAATPVGSCGIDVMPLELPRKFEYEFISSISAHALKESVVGYIHKLRSIFSPSELLSIQSADNDEERIKRFYRHWCLKEAHLKTIGCGLRIPLQNVCCHFPEDDEPYVEYDHDGDKSKKWIVEEHVLPNNHLVTVVLCTPEKCVEQYSKGNFVQLNYQELVDRLTVITPTSIQLWDQFASKPHSPPSSKRKLVSVQ